MTLKPITARPSSLQLGTCTTTGKRRYTSRRHARSSARRLHPGTPLRAYQCHACHDWHIGNLPHRVKNGDDW
ncbi:hypothetical protein [Streptomyces chumphonensis]|uniref:hypothetical protein n=1 Tax=Streptomyces chumphonensis TaxID=1214925 RepID=UPI003D748AE5